MALTGKQRRHLRGLGHELQPVVLLGKDGVTAGVIAQVAEQIVAHELIKVKIGQNAAVDRHETADELASKTSAELVQVLGNTILLYKRNDDEPKIELPRAK